MISFDSHWLEEFHQNLNQIFEQIERCFNNLINENISINKQIQLIQELINYIKNIQIICSNIRSPLMINKERQLNIYKNQLSKNDEISQNLIELLYDVLRTIMTYIQTYCQAFLIPYQIEICNQENQSINIEQFTSSVIYGENRSRNFWSGLKLILIRSIWVRTEKFL